PDVVAMRLQPGHLVEHRGARDVADPADDDPARLAAGVGVDRLDDRAEGEALGEDAGPRLRHRHRLRPRPRCSSAISRARSRFESRSAMSRVLSWSCWPRASPSSSLALPRVMYSRSGTIVWPLALARPSSSSICLRWSNSLRVRFGSWL